MKLLSIVFSKQALPSNSKLSFPFCVASSQPIIATKTASSSSRRSESSATIQAAALTGLSSQQCLCFYCMAFLLLVSVSFLLSTMLLWACSIMLLGSVAAWIIMLLGFCCGMNHAAVVLLWLCCNGVLVWRKKRSLFVNFAVVRGQSTTEPVMRLWLLCLPFFLKVSFTAYSLWYKKSSNAREIVCVLCAPSRKCSHNSITLPNHNTLFSCLGLVLWVLFFFRHGCVCWGEK